MTRPSRLPVFVVVLLGDLAAAITLWPAVGSLGRHLLHPQEWVERVGADAAAAEFARFGLWCAASWLAVGLSAGLVTAIARARWADRAAGSPSTPSRRRCAASSPAPWESASRSSLPVPARCRRALRHRRLPPHRHRRLPPHRHRRLPPQRHRSAGRRTIGTRCRSTSRGRTIPPSRAAGPGRAGPACPAPGCPRYHRRRCRTTGR